MDYGTYCSNECQIAKRKDEGYYQEVFDVRHEGEENPMKDPEVRQKMVESLTGRSLSEEHKDNLREAFLGESNPFYGREHTEESKQALSEALAGRDPTLSGEEHPWWKDGGSSEEIPWGSNWRPRRRKALQRDDGICQRCGSEERITIHHIVPRRFVFYHPFLTLEEHANTLENLITLCRTCHNKVEK